MEDPVSNVTRAAGSMPVVHTKMFRCKQCTYSCTNKEDYWAHQRLNHIKPEKLLECSKCSFVTEYKHHLEYHMRNHMGSKPFKCQSCDYACVNLSMLRSHMKSHSKSQQYNCADCAYSTKYYHTLKTHLEKFNHRSASESKKLKDQSSSCSSPGSQSSPTMAPGAANQLAAASAAAAAAAACFNPNEQLMQLQLAALAAAVTTQSLLTENSNNKNKDLKQEKEIKHFNGQRQKCVDKELYECVKCELLFRNYDMYVKHKQSHETEATKETSAESVKCTICSVNLNNSIEYFAHLMTTHNLNLMPLLQLSSQLSS